MSRSSPKDGELPETGDTAARRYPRYRALTGPDDDAFCYRVSEALSLGYELYGSPAATYDGNRVILCQALVWPADDLPPKWGARAAPEPSSGPDSDEDRR